MLYVKLGWKLFFWWVLLHMIHSVNDCGPLNIAHTEQEGINNPLLQKEKASYYWSTFLLNLRQRGHFYKKKKMDESLTCTWQNMAFQYFCSERCHNTTGCFCGGIHQLRKVIQEALTPRALLGIEHIKEGWASTQGGDLLFSYFRLKYLRMSAQLNGHRFIHRWRKKS